MRVLCLDIARTRIGSRRVFCLGAETLSAYLRGGARRSEQARADLVHPDLVDSALLARRPCQSSSMRGRKGKSAYQLAARSQVRRTGLVTLGVLVVTLALALAIARAWRLGVAGTAVTVLVAGGGPALLYVTWATFRDSALKTPQPGLAELADQLAVAMGRQWAAEASMRRLNDPYPLPVSWSPADPGLADSWEVLETLARTGAGWPVPDPGLWARHPGALGGEGEGLAAVLTRVPTGRLVVLGEPGSGKTMLMVRLVLDLLAGRSPGGPVPFLVSLASWNPEQQDLREWLAGQLAVGRPALSGAACGADGSVAEALLDAGLVVPLLDGLDEIPEPVRGQAIARINDALGAGQVTSSPAGHLNSGRRSARRGGRTCGCEGQPQSSSTRSARKRSAPTW